MTEQQYRELVVDFNNIAKKVTTQVPEAFAGDQNQICYHIRYACGLLRDIRAMMDMKENPNKVFAEFTPKDEKRLS